MATNVTTVGTKQLEAITAMHRRLETAVERGAAFLDAWRPDWPSLIDRDLLDLGKGGYCVVGQLEFVDEFRDALWPVQRDEDSRYPPSLGFELDDESQDGVEWVSMVQKYSILTELWLDAIRKRLGQGGARDGDYDS